MNIKVYIVSVLTIGIFCGLSANNLFAFDNKTVRGYEKPEVCLKSNIRCILKRQGDTLYWCLKSNLQRNLDTRRTTTPIKKTTRELQGNCAKIIPIHE